MSTVENNLIKAAWSLSKTNNEIWHMFIETLNDYTIDRLERATGSPTPEIHVSVGMARQALEFYKQMNSLDTLYEKIRQQEQRK